MAIRVLDFYLEFPPDASDADSLTSGFLSIVHSSGIEFLLSKRIHGLSP